MNRSEAFAHAPASKQNVWWIVGVGKRLGEVRKGKQIKENDVLTNFVHKGLHKTVRFVQPLKGSSYVHQTTHTHANSQHHFPIGVCLLSLQQKPSSFILHIAMETTQIPAATKTQQLYVTKIPAAKTFIHLKGAYITRHFVFILSKARMDGPFVVRLKGQWYQRGKGISKLMQLITWFILMIDVITLFYFRRLISSC